LACEFLLCLGHMFHSESSPLGHSSVEFFQLHERWQSRQFGSITATGNTSDSTHENGHESRCWRPRPELPQAKAALGKVATWIPNLLIPWAVRK
jgi:hypothetical protein